MTAQATPAGPGFWLTLVRVAKEAYGLAREILKSGPPDLQEKARSFMTQSRRLNQAMIDLVEDSKTVEAQKELHNVTQTILYDDLRMNVAIVRREFSVRRHSRNSETDGEQDDDLSIDEKMKYVELPTQLGAAVLPICEIMRGELKTALTSKTLATLERKGKGAYDIGEDIKSVSPTSRRTYKSEAWHLQILEEVRQLRELIQDERYTEYIEQLKILINDLEYMNVIADRLLIDWIKKHLERTKQVERELEDFADA